MNADRFQHVARFICCLLLSWSMCGVHPATAVELKSRSGGISVGEYPVLALTSTDQPVISTIDTLTSRIRLVLCESLSCRTPVTRLLAATQGIAPVAVTSANLPIIVYNEPSDKSVRLLRCTDSTCSRSTTTIVVATPANSTWNALRLTTTGNPVILYEDEPTGALKLLVCANPGCSSSAVRTVDATVHDGSRQANLTLTTTNIPVVSFYDATNRDLKIAVCADANCSSTTTSTVDSGGDVGRLSSIAITATHLPVVSYFDTTNNALKMVRCTNSTCTTSVAWTHHRMGVRPSGAYARSTILISSTNIPKIIFYDTVTADLMQSACNNTVCVAPVITTLDSGFDVGNASSAMLTSDGTVVAAYRDATYEHLKLYPGKIIIDKGAPSIHVKSAPAHRATVTTASVTLRWQGVANATEYLYCISTTLACPTWTSVGPATSATIPGLVQNMTYNWQVIAQNSAGKTWANSGTPWQFTVVVPPAAFSKTAPANAATNQSITPTLSWAASARATSYEYCIATTAATCTRWISIGTARSVTVPTLARNTSYYWNVRARNAGGVTTANASAWQLTTVR